MYEARAGDIPRPKGAAAQAIVGANWPGISESAIEEVAASHQNDADRYNSLGERTRQDRAVQAELLQGQAGDAHHESMTDLMTHDFDAADHFQSKVTTAAHLASVTRGTKVRLAQIIEAAEPEYNQAVKAGDPKAVTAVVAKYQPEVYSVVKDAWGDLALTPAPTTPPADPNTTHPLDNGTNNGHGRDGKKTHTDPSDPTKADAANDAADTPKPHEGANHDSTAGGDDPLGDNGIASGGDGPKAHTPPGALSGDENVSPPLPGMQQPQLPLSMMNGLGGARGGSPGGLSGGSGLSGGLGSGGLGSVARPPVSSSSFPTEAASAPGSPAAPSFSNPISQAASGFQSGLASGMGSSGAVPPAALEQTALQQSHPVVQQAIPVAGDAAGGAGTPAAASGPASGSGFGGGSAASTPNVAGGGAGAGGMMPPPAMGGGGLAPAPYSAPGAGSVPGPSSPTSPAGGAPTGAAPGSASAGAGPVLAGPAGSVGAAGVSSTNVPNPDLVAAQQILAGLVKSCPPSRPIFWAVSVLRTPVGPQTVIANSVGGGTYLPAGVRLPSTVRLAALDPALPFGWAEPWMGWQSPSAILVDHFERLQSAVRGVKVSAIATSELWPRHPECGGDFVGIRHEELLRSPAVPLTGSHRLASTDPALAARLAALDRGGDMSSWVGSTLTSAVIRAATEPDGTGSAVAVKEDAEILELVAHQRASGEDWRQFRQLAEQRDDGAVLYAPRDADDSPSTVNARMWYRHFYGSARIAELVLCWETQPVSIADIAYCGIAAGFGPVILAVVAEIEKRLAEMAAAAPE